LRKYVSSDTISQHKLDLLQADFDRARKGGYKYLLRFTYQNDYNQECPTLERILRHMDQLTPIIRDNADVIYCLQIGWIGMWGEFHSDGNGLDKDPSAVAAVTEKTLQILPSNRTTMMRRMAYRDIAEANSDFVKQNVNRIGFFNDGTLANMTDAGTFLGDMTRITVDDEDPEFLKVSRESIHLPVDGESFWSGWGDYTRMNPISALERFQKHHYTTFNFTHTNIDFDGAGPIEAWKQIIFTEEILKLYGLPCDENYFKHNSTPTAFDYIRDHLGYRIEMTQSEGSFVDGHYKGHVTLRNVGCASPVNPREIYLVLFDEKGKAYEYGTGTDVRILEPWKEVNIDLDVALPKKVKSENLKVALWMPDEMESIKYRTEYAITIAEGTTPNILEGRVLNVLP